MKLILILLTISLASCKNIEIPEYETVATLDCETLDEPITTKPSKIKHIYDDYYEVILPDGTVMKVSGSCTYTTTSRVKGE